MLNQYLPTVSAIFTDLNKLSFCITTTFIVSFIFSKIFISLHCHLPLMKTILHILPYLLVGDRNTTHTTHSFKTYTIDSTPNSPEVFPLNLTLLALSVSPSWRTLPRSILATTPSANRASNEFTVLYVTPINNNSTFYPKPVHVFHAQQVIVHFVEPLLTHSTVQQNESLIIFDKGLLN